MSDRRMLTKKVTDDDNFMSLSSSAQALYLHLSMSADDDGFSNQVTLSMFKAHASVQDLEALLEKRYIYQFENGVIVIKHWRMANALRKDRYTPTRFQEEYAQLQIKKNGSYTMDSTELLQEQSDEPSSNKDLRKKAYAESSLPYSFDYKIRARFLGKPCPVCGCLMQTYVDECGIATDTRKPTIQHNTPISHGGKHELGNISVICHNCNVSLRDTETGDLNASEVIEEWEKISGCQNGNQCLPQYNLTKDNLTKDKLSNSAAKRFTPPTVDEVKAYCDERGNSVDPERFVDFYASKGWMVGKTKMKDWKATVRNWERSEKAKSAPKQHPDKSKKDGLEKLMKKLEES